ncbi:MAG: hypothetical protein P1V97_08520 [Planctomycetota bacterium]|nr:hypothetical protein [Planctomycetota bacterium]
MVTGIGKTENGLTHRGPTMMRSFIIALCLVPLFCAPALAQDKKKKSTDMSRGDYFFKAGYYLKASESYRVAVLDKPSDTGRLMAFANSLFAVGNFHYSSHAIRRAVKYSPKKASFAPQVAPMFGSRLAYDRALDDLKRYVTYNRRDPSALTVLAYTYYADGEYRKAQKICGYLKLLDREDSFVSFMTTKIQARLGGKVSEKPKTKIIEIEPIKPAKKPTAATLADLKLPETKAIRETEKLKKSKAVSAVSE